MKPISAYHAIIFDLDGILADTEPGIFRIHQRSLLKRYGKTIEAQDFDDVIGLGYLETAAYFIDKYAIPRTPQALTEELIASIDASIAQVVDPIPAAQDFVRALARHGVRIGLASNSQSFYVRSVIETLGLSEFFPAPVARDDVPNGKPAADPYLEACRRAGADPRHSLAVEDSPVGLQAALAAGMEGALIGPVSLPMTNPKVHRFASIRELHHTLLH